MKAARDSGVNPALALALCALTGALFAWLNRLRMPNVFFFGPLAVTIALTVYGVQLSSLPRTLTNPAQMLLGCALGARFERRSLKVLQLGVPLVTAAHVVRVLVLIVTTGPAFRAARSLRAWLGKR